MSLLLLSLFACDGLANHLSTSPKGPIVCTYSWRLPANEGVLDDSPVTFTYNSRSHDFKDSYGRGDVSAPIKSGVASFEFYLVDEVVVGGLVRKTDTAAGEYDPEHPEDVFLWVCEFGRLTSVQTVTCVDSAGKSVPTARSIDMEFRHGKGCEVVVKFAD